MEHSDFNYQGQISQSRAKLRRRITKLLKIAQQLDCRIVRYHLNSAHSVFALEDDRDARECQQDGLILR
jgi:hypothetical protein